MKLKIYNFVIVLFIGISSYLILFLQGGFMEQYKYSSLYITIYVIFYDTVKTGLAWAFFHFDDKKNKLILGFLALLFSFGSLFMTTFYRTFTQTKESIVLQDVEMVEGKKIKADKIREDSIKNIQSQIQRQEEQIKALSEDFEKNKWTILGLEKKIENNNKQIELLNSKNSIEKEPLREDKKIEVSFTDFILYINQVSIFIILVNFFFGFILEVSNGFFAFMLSHGKDFFKIDEKLTQKNEDKNDEVPYSIKIVEEVIEEIPEPVEEVIQEVPVKTEEKIEPEEIIKEKVEEKKPEKTVKKIKKKVEPKQTEYIILGQEVKEFRTKNGMSYNVLGNVLGVHYKILVKVEGAKRVKVDEELYKKFLPLNERILKEGGKSILGGNDENLLGQK